jgi:hypothetical protein
MVGVGYVRHMKFGNLYLVGVQNKVEFHPRSTTRVGRPARNVRAFQPGGFHKQENFILTPERIEIAGDDDRLAGALDQFVQVSELKMTMPVLQREMDQKYCDVFKFEFDDQSLYTLIEVMKTFSGDLWCGQKRIRLFPEYR